jgi:2-polyprenyl-6-methoxyphenol hydroxylase-like FAD-dependent oxidoreductase
MPPLRILISGCSIAGPSTAYWLAKLGYRITLLERSPSLRLGGQAIDIRTHGVSVMRRIHGLEASVRLASTRESGVSIVNHRGESYGVISATGDSERQGLVSEYEIYRGDLSQCLVNLTKDNEDVKYVFGEQIASIAQNAEDGSVAVSFKNGLETQTYDLVVACDGSSSRTRAMALECGVRDYVHATNSWAAYFSMEHDLLNGSTVGQGHSAPGGRSISLGSDPNGGCRAMFMCVNQTPSSMETFRTAQAQVQAQGNDAALKAHVSQLFSDVGWLTQVVLREMTTSNDFYASEIVQVKPPSLFRNRIVLVGDAGYATGPTGFGTSIAMTGGYVLAGELGKHGGNVDAGLRAYEERMRPLISDAQKIPPFVGTIMAPQTRWGIWIRNHIFMLVAWSGVAEFVQRYLGAAFADAKEFPLPEYEWVKWKKQIGGNIRCQR